MVSEILGHSSMTITGDIYGHVSPDVAPEATDMLGDAFHQYRDGGERRRTSLSVAAAVQHQLTQARSRWPCEPLRAR